MWRILWLVLALGLAGCIGSHPKDVSPGTGRLVRWSQQKIDSPRKLIFLPGCVDTGDPNGMDPIALEDYYDQKVKNLNGLGDELLGCPTSEQVEFWFCGYYPTQAIDKIADDVAAAITGNSHFDNSCVAVVVHSEGGDVAWLLDQRHEVLAGGVVLGAPTLSTPVAHKDKRDAAVTKVFPFMHGKLIPLFDQIAVGTEQLAVSYPEAGQSRSQLMFFAGVIKAPPPNIWQRNIHLLDVLASSGDGWLKGMRDNRQFAELGAMIIANSDWRDNSQWDLASDGLVPVSSAVVAPNYRIWEGYDHWDLVSGKGDLALDRATLEWLIQVWQLKREWAESDLPETPDAIELSADVGDALQWTKFVYVNVNGKLELTDENWERSLVMPIAGTHEYPQFDATGQDLAFGVEDDQTRNVYILSGTVAKQLTFDGKSQFPAWSPNDRWLTYQSGDELLIHQLDADERYRVASGVDLIAPPVWTVDCLRGRIYWVNTNAELRWVSPRERNANATNLVQTGCGRPFFVRGPISGTIVISDESGGGNEELTAQRITVITGMLAKHLSVEIRFKPGEWKMDQDGFNFTLSLSQPFHFEEAVYDPGYNHLYLVGESGSVSGIYLFDIQECIDCTESGPPLEKFFYLVREGASQLTIRPSAP
jgi:pimeloyl-ACP methyl ester carboxylesterase